MPFRKSISVLILVVLLGVAVGVWSSLLPADWQTSGTVPPAPFASVSFAEPPPLKSVPAPPTTPPSESAASLELPTAASASEPVPNVQATTSSRAFPPALPGQTGDTRSKTNGGTTQRTQKSGSRSKASAGTWPLPTVSDDPFGPSSRPAPAVSPFGSLFKPGPADDSFAAKPPKDQMQAAVYAIGDMHAPTLAQVVAGVVPDARLAVGDDNKSLIVVAPPDQHETVRRVIRSLQMEPIDPSSIPIDPAVEAEMAKDESQIRVYATGGRSFQTLLEVLVVTAPGAQFAAGNDDKTLIVIGPPAEHEKVVTTLKSLAKRVEFPPTGQPSTTGLNAPSEVTGYAPTTTVYRIDRLNPATVMEILKVMLPPDATASLGADGKMLTVVSQKSDHEKVKSVLKSLQRAGSPSTYNQSPFAVGPSFVGPNKAFMTGSAEYPTPPTPYPSGTVYPNYSSGYRSAPRKPAPTDPEMAKLAEEDKAMGKLVAELIEEYKTADGNEERAEVRGHLKDTVEKHFKVRQSKRALELSRLEARLEKIRQSIAKRDTAKEQIVDRQISKLLGEADELAF